MNAVIQLCVDKLPLKSIIRLMVVSKSLLRFLTCECKFPKERAAHYFYEHQESVINVDLDGGCERVEIPIPTGWEILDLHGGGLFVLREPDPLTELNKVQLWNPAVRKGRVVVIPAPRTVHSFAACLCLNGIFKFVYAISLMKEISCGNRRSEYISGWSTVVYDIHSGIWSHRWNVKTTASHTLMYWVRNVEGGLALETKRIIHWLVRLRVNDRSLKWSVLGLKLKPYGQYGRYEEIHLPLEVAVLERVKLSKLPISGSDHLAVVVADEKVATEVGIWVLAEHKHWVKTFNISMQFHIDVESLHWGHKLLLSLREGFNYSWVFWNTTNKTSRHLPLGHLAFLASMTQSTIFLGEGFHHNLVLQAIERSPGFNHKLSFLKRSHQGKVRDTYNVGRFLVLVTTDRLCAFDRVLPLIPFRGQVLNKLSLWWFDQTREITPNAVLSAPDQNVTIFRNCAVFPVEFVVWGFVTGSTEFSLWMVYKKGIRNYCGNALPDGLGKNQRLESNILTLTSSDALITPDEIVKQGLMTREDLDEVSRRALSLFQYGQDVAAKKGLLLVNTKYKFGKADDGTILLIDEVHTPESSTFWIADSYLDCIKNDYEPENVDKDLPVVANELVCELALRYIFLYETITGCIFDIPDTEVSIRRRISQNVKSALAQLLGESVA